MGYASTSASVTVTQHSIDFLCYFQIDFLFHSNALCQHLVDLTRCYTHMRHFIWFLWHFRHRRIKKLIKSLNKFFFVSFYYQKLIVFTSMEWWKGVFYRLLLTFYTFLWIGGYFLLLWSFSHATCTYSKLIKSDCATNSF